MMRLLKFLLSDTAIFFKNKLSYIKHNLRGARVQPSCEINANAILDKGTAFFGRTRITADVKIGMFTYVTDSIIQNAIIGKFCSIAPGVKIGLNEHPLNEVLLHPIGYNSAEFNKSIPPVIIGNDVWLCANTVVLSGVRIGDGAVVAAGAIVKSDVEPFSVVGGVPAKVIGNRVKNPLFDQIIKCESSKEACRIIEARNQNL